MTQPLAFLIGRKPPVAMSPDLQRILALPRRPKVEPGTTTAEALINHVTGRYGRPPRAQCDCAKIQAARHMRPKPCLQRLNYVQAWTLHEMSLVGGITGQIAVGGGKTIIGLLAPLAMPGCRTAVMLVPSTLVGQLVNEYDLLAQHFQVPSMVIHAGPSSPQPRFVTGMPVLHVLPYSRFQRAANTVFLEQMKPDTLIVDEAQNLSNLISTRTSRFIRYFAENPNTRLCAWSGTLTDDEIQDYVHLAGLSLKDGSPVPLDPDEADSWGEALNPDDWVAPPGALKLLCNEGEDVQDGYHRRLVETYGFISTTGASISTPLEIQERRPPPLPADVDAHLQLLRAKWIRPDGEELLDAMSVARCARELACGLYLKWRFINGETEQLIKAWLAARKAWRAELREKLLRREPYLDSPLLCANAAMRAWGMSGPVTDIDENGRTITQAERPDVPHWRAESWPAWYEIRQRVKPITIPVRVNDFLARDAAEWGRQNKGIIWYKTVAFGQWVSELSGLPMHGGGAKAGEKILKEDGSRSIIASISSHGTGRDGLQRLFSTQLVSQPPSSAVAFEQLFGRLSRIGQEAEIIYAFLYRHTPEVRACVDDALKKALYCQKTMGQSQMLRAGYQIAA